MTEEKSFTKFEILGAIYDYIKELKETGTNHIECVNDLFDDIFNSDYYVVGTYKAEKLLNNYADGAFDAINTVKEYEENMLGEVNTDLSDPEKVANMLYYILGEQVFFEVIKGDELGSLDSDDINEILDDLKEELKEEKNNNNSMLYEY